MFELKVITHFAAAHQLRMVAKKCENLHGHNWKIEVRVAGETLNDAGVLIDFGKIKTWVSEIMDGLDHKFLNELACFKNGNPSSERPDGSVTAGIPLCVHGIFIAGFPVDPNPSGATVTDDGQIHASIPVSSIRPSTAARSASMLARPAASSSAVTNRP